jgi:hypothetical protein
MNEKYRLPLTAAVAAIAVVVVVAVIVGLGSMGSGSSSPDSSRSPFASIMPTAAPTPTDPRLTPEGATRAFFAAFNEGWQTDDPTAVTPYVTSTESSAYQSVSAFLGGEKAANRAAVITTQRLENMASSVSGDQATVEFDYTVGGYTTNLDGVAIETPNVLAPVHAKVTLKLVGGVWLVDAYTQTP